MLRKKDTRYRISVIRKQKKEKAKGEKSEEGNHHRGHREHRERKTQRREAEDAKEAQRREVVALDRKNPPSNNEGGAPASSVGRRRNGVSAERSKEKKPAPLKAKGAAPTVLV